jgi:hypothetical protein
MNFLEIGKEILTICLFTSAGHKASPDQKENHKRMSPFPGELKTPGTFISPFISPLFRLYFARRSTPHTHGSQCLLTGALRSAQPAPISNQDQRAPGKADRRGRLGHGKCHRGDVTVLVVDKGSVKWSEQFDKRFDPFVLPIENALFHAIGEQIS